KKSFRSTSLRLTEIGSPVYFAPFAAGFCCSNWAFCSAARFTAGWTPGPLPAACAMAALLFVATNSAAVLSAKRLAASCALAAGCAGLSSFLSSALLTEYLGSTKANSAGFPALSAEVGFIGAEPIEAEVAAAELTGVAIAGAEARTCGAVSKPALLRPAPFPGDEPARRHES